MNILTTLAQSYNTYSDTYSAAPASPGETALIFALYFVFLLIGLVFYVIISLSLMRIFKKAGVKPWIAWVPFYNTWKTLEIGGQQGFWAVLSVIPFVSFVSAIFLYIAMYHIGKKLGKDGAFVLLAIFLTPVWYIWLAADKSTWNDEASTAPSLAQ